MATQIVEVLDTSAAVDAVKRGYPDIPVVGREDNEKSAGKAKGYRYSSVYAGSGTKDAGEGWAVSLLEYTFMKRPMFWVVSATDESNEKFKTVDEALEAFFAKIEEVKA